MTQGQACGAQKLAGGGIQVTDDGRNKAASRSPAKVGMLCGKASSESPGPGSPAWQSFLPYLHRDECCTHSCAVTAGSSARTLQQAPAPAPMAGKWRRHSSNQHSHLAVHLRPPPACHGHDARMQHNIWASCLLSPTFAIIAMLVGQTPSGADHQNGAWLLGQHEIWALVGSLHVQALQSFQC